MAPTCLKSGLGVTLSLTHYPTLLSQHTDTARRSRARFHKSDLLSHYSVLVSIPRLRLCTWTVELSVLRSPFFRVGQSRKFPIGRPRALLRMGVGINWGSPTLVIVAVRGIGTASNAQSG